MKSVPAELLWKVFAKSFASVVSLVGIVLLISLIPRFGGLEVHNQALNLGLMDSTTAILALVSLAIPCGFIVGALSADTFENSIGM